MTQLLYISTRAMKIQVKKKNDGLILIYLITLSLYSYHKCQKVETSAAEAELISVT